MLPKNRFIFPDFRPFPWNYNSKSTNTFVVNRCPSNSVAVDKKNNWPGQADAEIKSCDGSIPMPPILLVKKVVRKEALRYYRRAIGFYDDFNSEAVKFFYNPFSTTFPLTERLTDLLSQFGLSRIYHLLIRDTLNDLESMIIFDRRVFTAISPTDVARGESERVLILNCVPALKGFGMVDSSWSQQNVLIRDDFAAESIVERIRNVDDKDILCLHRQKRLNGVFAHYYKKHFPSRQVPVARFLRYVPRFEGPVV